MKLSELTFYIKEPLKMGGSLAFLSGFIIFMGIITGEIYYPEGYSTHFNDISDLGSTRPPNSIIYQPSATIFNVSMIATGLLLLTSNIFVFLKFRRWIFSIPYVLFAIGILGVGIFPGNIAPYHGISSLLTFVMGSFTCISSYFIIRGYLGRMGIVIGIASLIFLFGAQLFIPHWGSGGTERWVAYPIVIWLIAFGGFLMGINFKVNDK